ncbi:MAG: glycosyltransferase [Bacteroidota bacterium]|nr:glycosyltransferase [Bacteroidota bacterium]
MKKILVITYYWPPSGGSGVQRWMYFCQYLPEFGIEPYIITVDEKKASYKFIDKTFESKVKNLKVYRTNTFELLKFYSKIIGGGEQKNIPLGFSGEEKPNTFQKISRYIRGNFFIPDARIGWNKFALAEAKKIITENGIDTVITTGPPHSTHLMGLNLKKLLNIKWIADFRDPWTEIYYNKLLYRNNFSIKKDIALEYRVLNEANLVLTIGPSMREHLQQRLKKDNEKFYFIYNGYDLEAFKEIKQIKDKKKFTICHIGILSESQPISTFIDALKKAFSETNEMKKYVKLQFVGRVSPSIITEIKDNLPGIEVELVEYLPHKKSLEYMTNADLLFNSLAEMENSKLLISGKLMEYIATGNPILCLGHPEGDAAKLLEEIDDARVFDRNDKEGVYNFVNFIFNKWKISSNLIKKDYTKYSRHHTTQQLSELIKNLN